MNLCTNIWSYNHKETSANSNYHDPGKNIVNSVTLRTSHYSSTTEYLIKRRPKLIQITKTIKYINEFKLIA